MRVAFWLAGTIIVAAVMTAPAGHAAGCPAKSLHFEDILTSLTKAPSCLKAQQVFEACRYEDGAGLSIDRALCRRASGQFAQACDEVDRRVEQLNAIVKKKCDAEAAQKPPQEACPAKSMAMDDIIAALNETPSCDRAMKVFEACEYGASGDVQFGAVVQKKCEGDFLARLKEPQRRHYQREINACDLKYRNESGTMYRSFAAFCRAGIAQRYSHKAGK